MKEVIALELGIYKDTRQRKNSRFFVEDEDTADWYKLYEGESTSPEVTRTQTLAEFAEASMRAVRVSGTQPADPKKKAEARNLDVLTK